MSEKVNLELDAETLSKIFSLTNSDLPELEKFDLIALKRQIKNISTYIEKLKNGEDVSEYEPKSDNDEQSDIPVDELEAPTNYNLPLLQFIEPSEIKREKRQYYDDNGHPVKGKLLIIDDLGTITYQLSTIFKRAGYLPITSKEIYDAVDKYKRSTYDYVVMDLFIPTDREGFILLEELKKISCSRKETPVFVVMSASTRKEHKQNCERRGVAFYSEKVGDWQKELFKTLLQY